MTAIPPLYLVRHATPDWARTDLPYHLPPGPPLTEQGEREAVLVGGFLRAAGVQVMWASPLERCTRTAELAARSAGAQLAAEPRLVEWQPGELPADVLGRLWPVWQQAGHASRELGPIALVTHGGPIAVLLAELGLPPAELEAHRRQYDRGNPLPPAGVWRATPVNSHWRLELAFTPG